MKKIKTGLIIWLVSVGMALSLIAGLVYWIDPYFHFHQPKTDSFYYTLDNQRSQNNGIIKNFEYNAIVTGTSMTENFKTSEADALFGTKSIKVAFSGDSFKEINDNLKTALTYNPKLKTIIRCLDINKFEEDKNYIRTDLGKFPDYLYDDNPFNDVKYLFNKDVFFSRIGNILVTKYIYKNKPGITSFDNYMRWQDQCTFGKNTLCPNGITFTAPTEENHLTDAERVTIKENIEQNVTSLPDCYPDVDFYYFITPYSAVWWKDIVEQGNLDRQIEIEQYVIELILQHPNIHLYSFNAISEITTNLNYYKDARHYGEWVNSAMLVWMKQGKYLLTKENYQNYLKEEKDLYRNFDYESLNDQIDYENDEDAGKVLLEFVGK